MLLFCLDRNDFYLAIYEFVYTIRSALGLYLLHLGNFLSSRIMYIHIYTYLNDQHLHVLSIVQA